MSNTETKTVAKMPDTLYDLATTSTAPLRASSASADDDKPRLQPGEGLKEAIALIRGGTSRHDAFLALAHRSYSDGRSVDDTIVICQEFYTAVGKEWTKDDESAVRRLYGWRDAQNSQPRTLAATTPSAPKGWRELVKHSTLGDILDAPPPDLREIIRGFLPEGYALLGGRPKDGKSWMALHLALAVARGEMAFGEWPCNQGRVLYISPEMGVHLMYKRLREMGIDKPEMLDFWWNCPPLDAGGMDALESYMEEYPDTSLILIDTYAKVKPTPEMGNVFDADYKAHDRLQQFANKYHIAVVSLIHTGKDTSRASLLDRVMGTTGVTAAVDGVYGLEAGKDERDDAGRLIHTARMEVKTRMMENATYGLRRLDGEYVWTISGDGADIAPQADLSENYHRVVDFINEAGRVKREPLLQWIVKNIPGVTTAWASQAIQRLHEGGQIARPERGTYASLASLESAVADSTTRGGLNALARNDSPESVCGGGRIVFDDALGSNPPLSKVSKVSKVSKTDEMDELDTPVQSLSNSPARMNPSLATVLDKVDTFDKRGRGLSKTASSRSDDDAQSHRHVHVPWPFGYDEDDDEEEFDEFDEEADV